MEHKGLVIYLIDGTDLHATTNKLIPLTCKRSGHKLLIVVNKMDTIPTDSIKVNILKH